MRIPIACTLGAEDARHRIAQWRDLLSRSITGAERVSHERLRLRLPAGPDVLAAAVELAGEEQACCEFFRFTIEAENDADWLVVDVPPEAAPVLDDLAGLVPASLMTSVHRSRPGAHHGRRPVAIDLRPLAQPRQGTY